MTLYRDTIRIAPGWRDRLRPAGLDSVDRVLKCLGDQVVAWSRSTETVRVDLPSEAGSGAIFIKRYHHLCWRRRIKAMLRGTFFGRSRARAEFEQLEWMLERHGPVVTPVAWGERRILHFVRSSFLITEAVGGAVSLTTFAQRHARGRGLELSWRQRRGFVESLGGCIGDLHRRGLVHGALFWRNVLVCEVAGGGFAFRFLDAPGRRRPSLRGAGARHATGVLNDLADMAALASQFCSRTEMLRFFLAYLGTRRLDDSHRQLARGVLERARPLQAHEIYRLQMNRTFHYHLVPMTSGA